MTGRPASRLKDPAVLQIVIGFVVTAAFVLLNALPSPWRLWAVAMVFLLCAVLFLSRYLGSGRVWLRTVSALVRNHWPFLSAVCICLIAVAVVRAAFYKLPADFLEARKAVAEIQATLPDSGLNKWWASTEPSRAASRIFTLKKYRLVVANSTAPDDSVLTTYVRNGERLAEDVRVPEFAYVRRYYRGDFNFAVDYFGTTRQFAFALYRRKGDESFRVIEQAVPLMGWPGLAFAYQ